ncbi:MAG: bifunctional demethylmenaquinone methyltransferase/2-methoxy-6-polyprenyl-1,4-benzoquinol methylase UbiE [Xanthomonadales bacterium]|nr:bifunctional demethylmenaquinone methyltransferase/2-methoxy-6-polyprenyl-1,4-benzoquinol methylase UbiE [Xanthomonadales bacterium]
MKSTQHDTTHFGYRDVPAREKTGLVRGVFESVAGRYDLMNDLMSLGVHRLWKRHFVAHCDVRPGHRVLDLAGGTGDIAALLAPRVGSQGLVILSDINEAMLGIGRQRMDDRGLVGNLEYVLANAEELPFPDASFDRLTIAFGLRNVTDKDQALQQMRRVLKPGGSAHVLEFSQLRAEPLRKLYDGYSFGVLPVLGKLIANDAESYQYLAESIRKHPAQPELAQMMRDAGFRDVTYRNLSGGIVAMHRGEA